MSLERLNQNSLQQEQIVQERINNSVKNNNKIVFNAGAGAGKTFALIESLKFIITNFQQKLEQRNQKIICVTYTNTAVKEIRHRLKNTDLVIVSTIHERLWDLIKDYKKELLPIHQEKLTTEVAKLNYSLNVDQTTNQYDTYRELNPDLQEALKNYLLSIKNDYYRNRDKTAAVFKSSFGSHLNQYPRIINNVTNFKKIVSAIYSIDKYQDCLTKIAENSPKYSKVNYDAKYNKDILYKMLISHDTLIEYANKMFTRHSLLRRLIIDKFPYILIDEYQDTNSSVVEIMRLLHQYADEKSLPLFIGYFGDPAQNIYDDGIGNRLEELHPDLTPINKVYNRRSHSEIITIINRIRGGEIEQESIYEDCTGGSVKFYSLQNRNDDLTTTFINRYRNQWSATVDKPLHCLVLTNKNVAKLSGFELLFDFLSSTHYYKTNFDSIGTEILSNELEKLGQIPLLFYKILRFKNDIENPQKAVASVLNESIYKKLAFADLKKLCSKLKHLTGTTLGEYITSIFAAYNEQNYMLVIKDLIKLDEYSYNSFCSNVFTKLFPNVDTENAEELNDANELLNNILNIPIEEFMKWFHFINETQNSDVIYHTYHGTKGREYDNVIIIMENNFGIRNRNKFSKFFNNVSDPSQLAVADMKDFTNTRNLLYVSCSRAKNNLRILYLDNTDAFNEGIIGIFGENHTYSGENEIVLPE